MTIEDLFRTLSSLSNPMSLHPKWVFRGQGVSDWSLVPSFARIANQKSLSREQALQLEREGINKFSVSARAVLPLEATVSLLPANNQIDFFGWYSLMQHFSAPTRALDWTSSPWVALYFASCEHEDRDGIIWQVDFEKAVSFAQSILPDHNFPAAARDPLSAEVVHLFHAINSNERIEAQQGRFTASTMTALGKSVCLLKDSTLKSLHTDLVGKLYREFNTQDPERTIPPSLEKWLKDKGIIG
jgi:hypothetical protein